MIKVLLTVLAVTAGILAAAAGCLLFIPFRLRTEGKILSGEPSASLIPEEIVRRSSGKLILEWLFVSAFIRLSKDSGPEGGLSLFGYVIPFPGRKKEKEKKTGAGRRKKKRDKGPFSLSSFCDSMKRAGQRIGKLRELIRDDETGQAAAQCRKSFRQALRAFRGGCLRMTGTAGMGDPAQTGALAAGLSLICPLADRLDVVPYFGEEGAENNAFCDLDLSWDTRIRCWHLLKAALGIITDRSCRKTFQRLKLEMGEFNGKS